MIFNVKNTAGLGKKCKVYAHVGLEIKAATKYNTRTREVEMFLMGKSTTGTPMVLTKPLKRGRMWPREAIKVKIKIPGSYIVVDGKKY